MSDDLRILTSVPREAFPILDALNRLHRDIGSARARLFLPGLDPSLDELRLLCVACADKADLDKLSRDLAAELIDDHASAVLASRVAIMELTHGLVVVAFREIPCLKAEGESTNET